MADDLYEKLTRKLVRGRRQDVNYQTLKAELWDEVQSDGERYLKMFFANWFNHNWARPLDEDRRETKLVKKHHVPRVVETPAEAKERRKDMANMFGVTLFNSFLPDGETRLKDATREQLRLWGAWYARLAKYVKAGSTLGRCLTAEQLVNVFQQVGGKL